MMDIEALADELWLKVCRENQGPGGSKSVTIPTPIRIREFARKLSASLHPQVEDGVAIGSVHKDTLAMLPSLSTLDGGAKIWPARKAEYDTAYVKVFTRPPIAGGGGAGALRHAAIESYRALNACAMFMANVEGENDDETAEIERIVDRAGGALTLLESAINPPATPPTQEEKMGVELPAGNLIEVGRIVSKIDETESNVYPFAMVIEFKDAESARAAMKAGKCKFTFMDSASPASGEKP